MLTFALWHLSGVLQLWLRFYFSEYSCPILMDNLTKDITTLNHTTAA